MSVLVAALNYNVFLGLGEPDISVCSQNDIHYAVRNALSLLTGQARNSDNNQLICVTNELGTLTSPYEIPEGELEMSTPAWVEVKTGERWKPLKVVNKAKLEDYYEQMINACSFYAIDQDNKTTQFIDFSFDPANSIIRIWFDQDGVPTHLDNTAQIPDNLTILAELMAMNTVISRVKVKMSQALESEEMRKILQLQMSAWNDLYLHNKDEIVEWKKLFRIWKNRSRSSQTANKLPRKTGRYFYGGY